MPPEIHDPVRIPLEKVVLNDWNPFEMSDESFSLLISEIEEDGFDENIQVVPIEGTDTYRVINGEHRVLAMRRLGAKEIPAVVKPDWEEDRQMMKTVRRNMIKGELLSGKFTRLIDRVTKRNDMAKEAIAKGVGFFDMDKFQKFYERKDQEEKRSREERAEKRSQSDESSSKSNTDDVESREDRMRAAVTTAVRHIFETHGDDVKHGFIFFEAKGHVSMTIAMSPPLMDALERLGSYCRSRKEDMATHLTRAIEGLIQGEQA